MKQHCKKARQFSQRFFNQLWQNANRRFVLCTAWLQSRPTPATNKANGPSPETHGIDTLQYILHTLLHTPGDIAITFTPYRSPKSAPTDPATPIGERVSLMANHAFTLDWRIFTPEEQRFLLWLGSMHQTLFMRTTPLTALANGLKGNGLRGNGLKGNDAKGVSRAIEMDQFVHSDVVWSKMSRRLVMRDLMLLCRWQDPSVDFISYYLLIAAMREQQACIKQRKKYDYWFLGHLINTLQGTCGPPHEMVVTSPRYA